MATTPPQDATPAPSVPSVLPAEAVALLQRAAQTPVTARDPLARTKAIEQANQRIRLQFPHLFKLETET